MIKPFLPPRIANIEVDWDGLFTPAIQANTELARFDGRLESVPDPDILLSPLITHEAVASSRIEGTQATLEEVLEFDADPGAKTSRLEDIEEVINYRQALFFSQRYLKDGQFTLNLIRKMHYVLLDGVRGKDKRRGEFRKDQNWIGEPGTPIEEATYIPPHPLELNECLSDWEKYYHSPERDSLIQVAILHAQFELIHPFKDGNGRIGRIIIPLFLADKNVLASPSFYVSSYMDRTRDEYRARLLAISERGDWHGWLLYFLSAVEKQARVNGDKVVAIKDLHETYKEIVTDLTRSKYSIKILDFLFSRPLFTSTRFAEETSIPRPSANRIIALLQKGEIIRPIREGSGQRPALYIFDKLFNMVDRY